MEAAKPTTWVGVDVGKGFHWAVAVGTEGETLLSRRVDNDEADLSALVEEARALADGEPLWAVDQPGGGAALLLTLCLLYTSPSPRDRTRSRMPSSA